MNSFNFKDVSNKALYLDLNKMNTLNGSSFAINCLSNIKRPTDINLMNSPNLKFLDQTIFQPFLESNPKNNISLYSSYLDCDDCRSYWLVKESKYLERFCRIHCMNGDFNDDIRNSSHLKNCK